MEVHTVKLESLTEDPKNARLHDEKNLTAIRTSLSRFGQVEPLVVQAESGIVIGGNGRLQAMRSLGWEQADVSYVNLNNEQATALGIALNRTAELATWDHEQLDELLKSLEVGDEFNDLVDVGFDSVDIDALADELNDEPIEVEQDEVQEPPKEPITKLGDVWLLGEHRVVCGDSTDGKTTAELFKGEKATLIHADPPYGMGKEKDGVKNDNIYRDKLVQFQMAWWGAFRPHIEDNSSVYIWGNAEELWRLWYGGLADSERLTLKNEIVWAKGSAGAGGISHIGAEGLRCYPCETERCLFFMLGEQGHSNNADNFWEGWRPLLDRLRSDCDACGWGAKEIKEICGVGMYGHWFTESQWTFIPEEHYLKLQKAAKSGTFSESYSDLKEGYEGFQRGYEELKKEFYATRSHFDNTHDHMTDVWKFGRVTGDERHGHATPKPVEMMARCIKSSSRAGDIVVEPFLGSGTTLIAAEQLGRKCYGVELSPAYVDVIVQRWENLTGKKAKLEK